MLIIILCILLALATLYQTWSDSLLLYPLNIEHFDDTGLETIGQPQMQASSLMRNLHNIVLVRNQVQHWIVNVPLTPFRAPLILFPPLPKDVVLPRSVLYNINYLSPVRNQGDCGCCWAFALADTLADRAMLASGGRFRHGLSVQQLLTCFDRTGCDGGSPEDAAFWLTQPSEQPGGRGLNTETRAPFKQGSGGELTGKCEFTQSTLFVKSSSVVSIVEFIPEEQFDVSILKQNILNMKRCLFESGPFYCAMTVYDDFFSYGGTEPYKPRKGAAMVGGHAIEVIGYCEQGVDKRPAYNKVAYWICKNSWGSGWPTQTTLNGYFTIVMGANVCGIESRCGYAVPEVFGPSYTTDPVALDTLRTITV
jgi:hypothetical protein